MPRFMMICVSVCSVHCLAPGQRQKIVSNGYKASAFDNAKNKRVREKPLPDKDLTASIEVNS